MLKLISSLPQINNYRPSKIDIKSNNPVQKALCKHASGEVCNDSISFKADFTPLEQQVIKEITEYSAQHGVETARVINRKGELLDLNVLELPGFCSVMLKEAPTVFGKPIKSTLLSVFINSFKLSLTSYEGIFLHTHTKNVPLSHLDIQRFREFPIKKMVAASVDGCYSLIERPERYSTSRRARSSAFQILRDSQIQCSKDLKLMTTDNKGNLQDHMMEADKDTLEKYSRFSIKLLQEYADATGCRFEHNFDVS